MQRFAIVGLPGLVPPLEASGRELLTPETDPASVNKAIRSAPDGTKVLLVVKDPDGDAALTQWVQVQVARRTPVLLLRSNPDSTAIAGTRSLDLPATIDEIMGVFKAKPRGDAIGSTVLGLNGEVTSVPTEDDIDDPWDSVEWPDDDPVTEIDLPMVDPPEPSLEDFEPDDDEPLEDFEPDDDLDIDLDDDETGPFVSTVEPWSPPLPELPAAPVAPVEPIDEMFASSADRRREQPCQVVISWAGKGGVGKTTGALALAQRAAELGGLRVCVIDGNRGQDDVRKYLRVVQAKLPSVYDAAVTGETTRAFVDPVTLSGARHSSLQKLGFGVALAPREGQADPKLVPTRAYADVVTAAREFADLVVIDTQIAESFDTSELFDSLYIPLLQRPHNWSIGWADTSNPGVMNLQQRLAMFASAGVPKARSFVAVNRVPATTHLNVTQFAQHFNRVATFVGSVPSDTEISTAFESGRIPHDAPALARVLDEVLFRVTGDPIFDPDQHPERYNAQVPTKKRSIFGRFGGAR